MTSVVFPPLTEEERARECASRDISVTVERLPDGRLVIILPEPSPASLPRVSHHDATLRELRDGWRLRLELEWPLS